MNNENQSGNQPGFLNIFKIFLSILDEQIDFFQFFISWYSTFNFLELIDHFIENILFI